MKKTLLLLSGILLVVTQLFAQLTLTQSSYPSSVLGTDTVANTTVTSTFPNLTSMTNATWDMTSITDTTFPSFIYRVATSYYQFADSNFYNLSILDFQGNVQSSITSAGLYQYSVKIPYQAYAFSLADSIVFFAQTDTFSTPRTVLSFPATYGNTWASSYHSNFNFGFTDTAIGFNHAYCTLRAYVTETDTVKGYGQMRVKNLSGDTSAYYSVIQLQTTTVTVDSFFLNDSLPTLNFLALLSSLGYSQGQRDTTYSQSYYRPSEVTPMAQVSYNDATFSHPASAATLIQNLGSEGVATVPDDTRVSVFPNPVTGGVFSICLPPAVSGPWSYELIDMSGKTVQDNTLKPNGGNVQIILHPSLPTGIYYLMLNNNGQKYCVKPIEVTS